MPSSRPTRLPKRFFSPLRLCVSALKISLSLLALSSFAADWQWSVETPGLTGSRSFLWIPPACSKVRAVVAAQHNMIEQGILEHPEFRKTLADLSIAEVWVAPPFDGVFKFDQGAGERFTAIMKALADDSGYSELSDAPVIPMGHSACASYPWNFAAWNPARTLAILSVHGDAPLTNMTGSGHPNPDWGNRNIDGIPGLMVMGEYEWLEGRLDPAIQFRAAHPDAPIATLAEPGRGHFDVSEDLIHFLTMFIRKAAEARLPLDIPVGEAPILKPIDPKQGWLVERWHRNQPRDIAPAPFASYKGDPRQAFWAFDKEMALATQNYRADQIGKLPQLLGFIQDGKVIPQSDTHNQVTLHFEPLSDGVTFKLSATFLDKVESGSKNLSRWTQLPPGSPLGHATGGGPIVISPITGPVKQIDANNFAISLNRAASTVDKRAGDIWLLASQPGDARYKSIVQQALMRITPNTTGADQHITFPGISSQSVGTPSVKLAATSDAGTKVSYYVREGPAEIDGDTLAFTPIPPRAKFPVKVTVVAWQWGRSVEPKLKTAAAVERTFDLVK
jgi:hypothetical protein